MTNPSTMLLDDEELEITAGGQRWLSSWYAADKVPAGKPHGSAGICVTDEGDVILISADGVSWDFPAGRPEGDESREETLRREMMEEACAVVQEASLLGFSRGRCVEGPEQGLVLVRSIWLARVRLLDWKPEFEIRHRKVAPAGAAILQTAPAYHPVWRRAFAEAKLSV